MFFWRMEERERGRAEREGKRKRGRGRKGGKGEQEGRAANKTHVLEAELREHQVPDVGREERLGRLAIACSWRRRCGHRTRRHCCLVKVGAEREGEEVRREERERKKG